MKKLLVSGTVLILLLAGCIPSASGISATAVVSTAGSGMVMPATLPPADYTPPVGSTPIPPTSIPAFPGGLPPAELKYRLLETYPDFFFCDPDYFPVAHEDEKLLALERFLLVQGDLEQFRVILAHTGLSGLTDFTDDQKLLLYREYKRLNALVLEPADGGNRFRFQVGREGEQAYMLTGSIDPQGKIKVESKEQSIATCPICLAAGTLIDTPDGPIPVQDLQPGDLVWSVDKNGQRMAVPILLAGHVDVPASHRVLHLRLEDGRELWVSPGHPLTDGRIAADLMAGDILDQARIMEIELVSYGGKATYDILPAGGTGYYWANNILIASTLNTQP